MNIGILGWWRAGNQGDFVLRGNLERALAPHRVVPIDLPFSWTPDEIDRLNLLDFIILGGGGLFQETPPIPFDTFDVWGHRLTTPIGAWGVGIDTVAPRYRLAIEALVQQARFFYVRDPDSGALLQSPKVRVAPDLSFLYPFPGAAAPTAQGSPPVCGVNLRVTASLEMDRWIEALRQLPVQLRGIPLSTYNIWQEAQTLRKLDAGCPAAFDPGLYCGLNLMIGTAFHSVLFSIQAGIPTIAIAYAPKVRRIFTELGLEQWLLGTKDWDKLSALVRRAVESQGQLADQLQAITRGLTQAAQEARSAVLEEIERAAKPRPSLGPRVSVIVAGSASEADNTLTLASCQQQTYNNLEIIFVGRDRSTPPLPAPSTAIPVKMLVAGPAESLADQLNRGLAAAEGEYISWLAAGNYYASDAIGCLAGQLDQKPDWDMVFADYYTLHAVDYIADVHRVDAAYKLFRGNVVGPCFLFRRKLGQGVGALRADTPLAAYDYWLRAVRSFRLAPVHARLFFAQLTSQILRDPGVEHEVRQRWRATQAWPGRLFWRLADSDFVDHSVIRPVMSILRRTAAVGRQNR